jgi:hypothetical protein
MLKPLPGNIFAFLQNGERVTKGGIFLRDDNGKDHGIRPRWGKVWKVADDITDVVPGQWILVEHGRWTMTINYKDPDGAETKFNKIDPAGILLVTDNEPEDEFIGEVADYSSGQARPEDFGAR